MSQPIDPRAPGAGPPWPATPPAYPAPTPSNGGSALAITAIVMSALALLAVALLGVYLVLGAGAEDAGDYADVLAGTVAVDGGVVDGADLEDELGALIEADMGSVEDLTCPPSMPVAMGDVVLCSGVVDGSQWAFEVIFADPYGSFVVDPI